ncbi:MAG: barstar family protein, partial [Neisseriaceae bacterium]|nr:barstar family protein [Neisseriaceae bacterium]
MIFPNDPAVYVSPYRPAPKLAADAHAQAWQWPKLNQINKATIMMAAKSLFVLPAHFGDNWDALYDALTEQSWCPYAPNLWTLPLYKANDIDWDEFAVFLDICQDLCDFLAANAILL